jgi:hypothetical protein
MKRCASHLAVVLWLFTQIVQETVCATVKWRIPQSGRWSLAANWDPARLPGSLDDVIISAKGNYTVTSDVQVSVASLVVEEPVGSRIELEVTSSLTVLGRSQISQLKLSNQGKFLFQDDVLVKGSMLLHAGCSLVGLSGLKTISVERDITVAYSTSSGSKSETFIENSILEVQDRMFIFSPQQVAISHMEVELGDAKLVLHPGAELTMEQRSQITYKHRGSLVDSIENKGHIQCTGAGRSSLTDKCWVGVHLQNEGSLSVDKDASLHLTVSSDTSGSINVSDSATLYLTGTHNFKANSHLTVEGLLDSNGDVFISSSSPVLSDGHLLISGGTMQLNVSNYGVVELGTTTVTRGNLQVYPIGDDKATLQIKKLRMTGNAGLFETSVYTVVYDIDLVTDNTNPQLKISSSMLVTGSLLWKGGQITGPGTFKSTGSVRLSPHSNSVFLYVLTSNFENTVTFETKGHLVLGTASTLTVGKQAVFTIASADTAITGSQSQLNNRGTIRLDHYHVGTSYISTGEFNNYGHVIIQTDIASSLVVKAAGKLEGTYAIGHDNTLELQANLEGDREGSIVGNGSLKTSGSSVQLANVNVDSVVVTGGSLTVQTPLIKETMTLSTLEVTNGRLATGSGIVMTVGFISISGSGAVLELNSETICDSVQLSSGQLHTTNNFTVQTQFTWTQGTIMGRQDHSLYIQRLFVYSASSKIINGAQLVIVNMLRATGHGLIITLSNGASLETATGAVTEIMGSSVRIRSSDHSSMFVTKGQVNAVATALYVSTVWQMLGAIHLINSDVTISRSSSCEDDIHVGQNSSLELNSAFAMFPQSHLLGMGSLVLSATADIDLYNIAVESIAMTGTGHVTLYYEDQNPAHIFTSLQVTNGILEIRSSISITEVQKMSISLGQFISWMPLRIVEMTISGGIVTFHKNVWITRYLEFVGGKIEGPKFDQVNLYVSDKMGIVGQRTKYLQAIQLIVENSATWRGYGNLELTIGAVFKIGARAEFTVDTKSQLSSINSAIENSGMLTIQDGRQLTMSGNMVSRGTVNLGLSSGLVLSSGSTLFAEGYLVLDYGAVVTISSGNHRFLHGCSVTTHNTSHVDIRGGSLSIDKFSMSGIVSVAGALTVHSINPSQTVESFTVTGSGMAVFQATNDDSSGVLNIKVATVKTSKYFQLDHPAMINKLHLQSGTVKGTGNVKVVQLLWQAGSLTGMRKTTWQVLETFNFIETATKYLYGYTLEINGKGVWSGSGTLLVGQGAVVEFGHKSDIHIESNLVLETQTGGIMYNYGYIEYNPVIQLPGFLTVKANFYNYGKMKVLGQGGLLIQNYLQSDGSIEVSSHNSSIQVENGGELFSRNGQLYGHGALMLSTGRVTLDGLHTDISAIHITAGTVEIRAGQINGLNFLDKTKNGTDMVLQRLLLEGSSSRFESSNSLNIERLDLAKGIVSFAGLVNISRAIVSSGTLLSQATTKVKNFEWQGGSIAGSGRLECISATILYSSVKRYISAYSTVALLGETTLVGPFVDITLKQGAQLINEANGSLSFIDSNGILESTTGAGTFINNGFVKVVSSDSASTDFSLRIVNNGHLQAMYKSLRLSKSVTHRGQIEILQQAIVDISGDFDGLPGSTLSGFGQLSFTNGESFISSLHLDVKHMVIDGGSVTVVAPSGYTLQHINQIELNKGYLTVSVHSNHLKVQSCYMYGGFMTTYAPVNFLDYLKIVKGSFRAYSVVSIGGTFLFAGGTLQGNKLEHAFFVKSMLLKDYGAQKEINGKRVVVTGEGNWTVNAGSQLVLLDSALIEITPTATFHVDYKVGTELIGFIKNLGHIRISRSGGTLSHLVHFQRTIDNYGSITVETEARVTFSNIACHGNASLSVGYSAVVELDGTVQSCSINGSGILKVESSGFLEVDETSNLLNMSAVEVLDRGTLQTSVNISIPNLTIIGGTLEAVQVKNITIEITDHFICRGSSVKFVKVNSLGSSDIAGSNSLIDAKLVIHGQSQFGGVYTTTHSMIFHDGSELEFSEDCRALFVGSHVFTTALESTVSVAIYNEGWMKTAGQLSSVSFEVDVLNEGVIDANSQRSTIVFSELRLGSGLVSASGQDSVLQVSGSDSQTCHLNIGYICSSCVVSVGSSTKAILNSTSTPVLRVPRLESVGSVSFFDGNVEVEYAILSQQARLELHPLVAIHELYMRDSPQVLGSSDQIGSLIFVGGSFGPTSGPATTVSVKILSVALLYSKKVDQCEMTITESANFQSASLALKSGSRLRFASTANVLLDSNTDIVGDDKTLPSGGELINDGTMTVDVLGGQNVRLFAYLSNVGNLHVVRGEMRIVGNSAHSGTLKVSSGGQLQFDGSGVGSFATNADVHINGSLRVVSASSNLQLNFQSFFAENVVIDAESGGLELRNSGCIGHLWISKGTAKVSAFTAVNQLSMTGGTLDARNVFSVNGLAQWIGGEITVSGTGVVNFNGPTDIKPGLTGSPVISNTGQCPVNVSCTECVVKSDCVWYMDGNSCNTNSSYRDEDNFGNTCQSWITTASRCLTEPHCENYYSAGLCVAHSSCEWCAAAEECSKVGLCTANTMKDVIYWASPESGSWSNAESWSSKSLPVSTSNVFVSRGWPIDVSTGSSAITVLSLTIGNNFSCADQQPNVQIQGAVTVTDLTVMNGATLELSSGSLTWTGKAAIYGNFIWRRGEISGPTLEVYGSLWVSGSRTKTLTSNVYLHGAGTLSDSFVVNFQANKEFYIMSSGHLRVEGAGKLLSVDENRKLINNGALTVNTGASNFKVEISPEFVNRGTLSILHDSVLQWYGTVYLNGTVKIGDDALIYVSSPNKRVVIGSLAAISGLGKIVLQNGQTEIQTKNLDIAALEVTGVNFMELPNHFAISRMVFSKGVIRLAGNITVKDVMEWRGGQIEGLHSFIVEKQLVLLASRYQFSETKSLSDTSFIVRGNVSFIPGTYSNYVKIAHQGNAQFVIDKESEMKTVGVSSLEIQSPITLHGHLTVSEGTVLYSDAGITSVGSLIIAKGSTLSLQGGSSVFDSSSYVTIQGSLSVEGSSTKAVIRSTVSSPVKSLVMRRGTLSINTSLPISTIESASVNCYYSSRCEFNLSSVSGEGTSISYLLVKYATTVLGAGVSTIDYLHLGSYSRILIQRDVYVDQLDWNEGQIESQTPVPSVLSVKDMIRTGSSTITVRSVHFHLLEQCLYLGAGEWVFDNGGMLVVPTGSNVSIVSVMSLSWHSNQYFVINGTVIYDAAEAQLQHYTGISFLMPILCFGEFRIMQGTGTTIFSGNSVIEGKLVLEEQTSLVIGGGNHLWQGQLYSNADSSITVRGSGTTLVMQASRAVIEHLTVQDRSDVTLKMLPDALLLESLTVNTNNNGQFRCAMHCTIVRSLNWISGKILAQFLNSSITAGQNCSVWMHGTSAKYTGAGSMVIEGHAAFVGSAYLYMSGILQIAKTGVLQVFNSITFSHQTTGASLENYGKLIVEDEAICTVGVPYNDYGSVTVKNLIRLVSTQSIIGKARGKLEFVWTSSSLVISGLNSYTVETSASIIGAGRLRVAKGKLLVLCPIDTDLFTGSLVTEGTNGVIRISSNQKVTVSSAQISSGQLEIERDFPMAIGQLDITRGRFRIMGNGTVTVENVDFSGSSSYMDGDANMVVLSTFLWGPYGHISGKRKVVIMGHLLLHNQYQTITETEVIVNGSAVFGGQDYLTINSQGKLVIAPTAIARFLVTRRFLGSNGMFVNQGKVFFSGEQASVTINIALNNTGLLVLEKGSLTLGSTSTLSGEIQADLGTSLKLSGSTTFETDSKLVLQQATVMTTATVNMESNMSQVLMNSLFVNGGTLSVKAIHGLYVESVCQFRGIVQLSSKLRCQQLTLQAGSNSLQQSSVDGGIVVKEMSWTSGVISGLSNLPWITVNEILTISSTDYRKHIDNGGLVANGHVLITERATLSMQKSAQLISNGLLSVDSPTNIGSSSTSLLVNRGKMIVDIGFDYCTISVPFVNEGQVAIDSGSLSFTQGGQHKAGSEMILGPESTLRLNGGNQKFESGSVDSNGVLLVTAGTVEVISNATAVNVSRIEVSGGSLIFRSGVQLSFFESLRVTGRGTVEFTSPITIGHVELVSGTVTLPKRFTIKTLLIASTGVLQGGKAKQLALLTVEELTLNGGTIKSAMSGGKYMFVNVTKSMLISSSSSVSLSYCDVFNQGQGRVVSPAQLIFDRARLVNTRLGVMDFLRGDLRLGSQREGAYVNFGTSVVETSGPLQSFFIYVQFINSGGRVLINTGHLRLYGGGQCNGTDGVIEISGNSILEVGGQFVCSPETLVGKGKVKLLSSGNFLLLSAVHFTLPLEINTGTVTVPSGVNGMSFLAPVSLAGGTLVVNGLVNITTKLDIARGTLSGSGVLSVAKGALMVINYVTSTTVSLQVHNHGNLQVQKEFSLGTVMRNEKSGVLSIIATGSISGTAGVLQNAGMLVCRVQRDSNCRLGTRFRNYRTTVIESGRLYLSYYPQLVDGSSVTGLGSMSNDGVASMHAAGLVNVDWTISSDIYLTGPLYSRLSCIWDKGSIQVSSDISDDCMAFSPPSNMLLNSACEEVFFVNEGNLSISASSYVSIEAQTSVINKGFVSFDDPPVSLTVKGQLVNDKSGQVTIIGQHPLKAFFITGSGVIINEGLFRIENAKVTVDPKVTNFGSMFIKGSTAQFNELMGQRGKNSRMTLNHATVHCRRILIEDGILQGNGQVQGSLVNQGTLSIPKLEILNISKSFTQSRDGILFISVTVSDGSLATSLLHVQGDPSLNGYVQVSLDNLAFDRLNRGEVTSPFLTFGGSRAGSSFMSVGIVSPVQLQLTIIYQGNSAMLKKQ